MWAFYHEIGFCIYFLWIYVLGREIIAPLLQEIELQTQSSHPPILGPHLYSVFLSKFILQK